MLLLVGCLLVGCKSSDAAAPSDANNAIDANDAPEYVEPPLIPVVLSDDARLPENDTMFEAAEVSADTVILHFTGTPELSIEPGNVIVGESDGGFLRRVDGVTSQGNTLTVSTSQATLVDLVAEGSIEISTDPSEGWDPVATRLLPGGFVDDQEFFREYQGDGFSVTKTFVNYSLFQMTDFRLRIDVENGRVSYGRMLVKCNYHVGVRTLNVQWSRDVSPAERIEQRLDTFNHSFKASIAGARLPADLTLDFESYIELDVTGHGSYQTTFESQGPFNFDLRYDGARWTDSTPSRMTGTIEHTITDRPQGKVRVGNRVTARSYFAGRRGPWVVGVAQVNGSSEEANCNWTSSHGLSVSSRAYVEVDDDIIDGVDTDLQYDETRADLLKITGSSDQPQPCIHVNQLCCEEECVFPDSPRWCEAGEADAGLPDAGDDVDDCWPRYQVCRCSGTTVPAGQKTCSCSVVIDVEGSGICRPASWQVSYLHSRYPELGIDEVEYSVYPNSFEVDCPDLVGAMKAAARSAPTDSASVTPLPAYVGATCPAFSCMVIVLSADQPCP